MVFEVQAELISGYLEELYKLSELDPVLLGSFKNPFKFKFCSKFMGKIVANPRHLAAQRKDALFLIKLDAKLKSL